MLQNLEPVSKSEWVAWRQSKCTQKLLKGLAARRNELLDEWGRAGYSSDEEERRAQGQVQSLEHTILYIIQEFDYIREEDSGNQSNRS